MISRPAATASGVSFGSEVSWWAGLAVVLPLALSDRAMAPTGPLRFLVLSLFLVAFLLFFCRNIQYESAWGGKLNRVLIMLAGVFVGMLLACSLTAINKQAALYTSARFLLFFLMVSLFARTVVREEQRLIGLFKVLVMVMIGQATAAILQYYEIAFTELPPGTGPPYGLMANRNLLGSGLALLLPLCACLIYAGDRRWRIVAGTAMLLGIYALILAQTRGAWAAVCAAVFITSCLVVLFRAQLGLALVKGWFKSVLLLLAGTAAAVLIATSMDHQELRSSLSERALSFRAPAADQSFQARLHFWRECLQIMHDCPLLGVGPGNWRIAAPNYSAKGSSNADGIVTRDRAHNVYLQTGAEMGIPGLIIYVAMWLTIALVAFRAILLAPHNDSRIMAILAFGGICTFAADAFVSFPDEFGEQLLFFSLSAGLAIGIYHAIPRPPPPTRAGFFRLRGSIVLVVVIALLLFNTYLDYAQINFEYHCKRANAYKKLNRYETVLDEVEAGRSRLVSLSPLGDPLELYSSYAYAGLGHLGQALTEIQRAQKLTPWNVRVWNEMGTVYVKMQRFDDAIRCFQEALRMAPEFDVALKNLGNTYHLTRKFREASEALSKSKLNDEYSIKLLGSSYLQLKEYEKSAKVMREGLARFPDQPEFLESLAYLEYAHLDRKAEARAHFQRLLALKPDHPKRAEYSKVLEYLSRSQPGKEK
jgi:O-antigen ligase